MAGVSGTIRKLRVSIDGTPVTVPSAAIAWRWAAFHLSNRLVRDRFPFATISAAAPVSLTGIQ